MKVPQRGFIESKAGVLGDVTAGTEMAVYPRDDHATQIRQRIQGLENRPKFDPHGARHGIELARMTQHHAGNARLQCLTDATAHSAQPLARLPRPADTTAAGAWRPNQTHIAAPPRIIGTHSHCPMLMPSDRRPR